MEQQGLSLGGFKKPVAGKLAFGFKAPKAKIAAFAAEESDESDGEEQQSTKRQRLQPAAAAAAAEPVPDSQEPADLEVKKVADRLAEFVAKNGAAFEEVTRQRNPGNTPFSFLYDTDSTAYRYYVAKVREAEAQLAVEERIGAGTAAGPSGRGFSESSEQAPQPSTEAPGPPGRRFCESSERAPLPSSEAARPAPPRALAPPPSDADSLAALEHFTKLAAQKEEARQEKAAKVELLNETSFDRRRQVAVYDEDGKRGHHMQDFIPKEELARILSKSGDEGARAQAEQLEQRNRIQSDNIGHRLLSKMGWQEGQGLGASNSGIAKPVAASGTANEKLGLGAAVHGEVEETDDAFTAYKKRMALGYKHRPNPLGNPRKSYY